MYKTSKNIRDKSNKERLKNHSLTNSTKPSIKRYSAFILALLLTLTNFTGSIYALNQTDFIKGSVAIPVKGDVQKFLSDTSGTNINNIIREFKKQQENTNNKPNTNKITEDMLYMRTPSYNALESLINTTATTANDLDRVKDIPDKLKINQVINAYQIYLETSLGYNIAYNNIKEDTNQSLCATNGCVGLIETLNKIGNVIVDFKNSPKFKEMMEVLQENQLETFEDLNGDLGPSDKVETGSKSKMKELPKDGPATKDITGINSLFRKETNYHKALKELTNVKNVEEKIKQAQDTNQQQDQNNTQNNNQATDRKDRTTHNGREQSSKTNNLSPQDMKATIDDIINAAEKYSLILKVLECTEQYTDLSNAIANNKTENDVNQNQKDAVTKSVEDAMSKASRLKIKLAGIWDEKEKKFTDDYLNLIAWTANFEPFINNIYSKDILASLSRTEKELYTKNKNLRSPLYRVTTESGAIDDIKTDANVKMNIITLAEFIDRVEMDELVLTTKRINKKIEPDNVMEKFKKLDIGAMRESNNSGTSDDTINNKNTDASEYNQSQDRNPVEEEAGVASTPATPDTNTEQQSQAQDGETVLNASALNTIQLELDDIQIRSSDIEKDFIAPIYVSSGKEPKRLIDDYSSSSMGEDEIKDSEKELSFMRDNIVSKENKIIDIVTAQHANSNYVNMMNTLRDQNYKSTGVQEDLYLPLYVDFLGNIITESGYIVVPAAANYTYMMNVAKFPMYNAMFINAYPEVYQDRNGSVNIANKDVGKFIYIKTKYGLMDMKRAALNGELFGNTFTQFQYQSRSVLSQEITEPLVVNFMDPLNDFIPLYGTFTDTQQEFGNENDSVFTNEGLGLRRKGTDGRVKLKLERISNNGNGYDWDVITEANRWLLDQEDTLNKVLVASIASTVINSPQYISKEIPYEGDIRALMDNYIIRESGEKLESVYNSVISSIKKNLMFYMPTASDVPILGEYAYLSPIILLTVSLIAYALFIVKMESTVFFRQYSGLKALIIGFIAVMGVGVISIMIIVPKLGIFFNSPGKLLMKNEAPLFVVNQIENQYKNINNNFFDKSKNIIDEQENAEIVLAKLNKKEVEKIRNSTSIIKSFGDLVYLSSLDNNRVNVIGDKIYLQKNELKIKIKDLMDISYISEVLRNDYLMMESSHTGYGEISYYTPYFNIAETLTDNVNKFSSNRGTPFSLVQYKKGKVKITGRINGFIKSIVFIYPNAFDEYMENKGKRMLLNKFIADSELLQNKDILDVQGLAIDSTLKQSKAMTEDQAKEKAYKEMSDSEYREKYRQIKDIVKESIDLDNEDQIKTYDNLLATGAMGNLSLEEKIKLEAYLDVIMGGDARDWLGLNKVLLYENDQNIFSPEYHDAIRASKWFPKQENSADPEYYEKEILPRIYKVNDNTKKFILKNLNEISLSISDESLVKIISLYASMEFNRQFDSLVSGKLWAKNIEMEGISNQSVLRTLFIPGRDLYKGVNANLVRYLAENTSGFGLVSMLIYIVLLLIRFFIRAMLVYLIVVGIPYMLIYQLIFSNRKEITMAQGALTTTISIVLLTGVESLIFKITYYLTNNIGVVPALLFAVICTAGTTFMYLNLFVMIVTDIPNFGYSKIKQKVLSIQGINLDSLSNRMFAEKQYNNSVNDMYQNSANNYDGAGYEGYEGYAGYEGYYAGDTNTSRNLFDYEDIDESNMQKMYRTHTTPQQQTDQYSVRDIDWVNNRYSIRENSYNEYLYSEYDEDAPNKNNHRDHKEEKELDRQESQEKINKRYKKSNKAKAEEEQFSKYLGDEYVDSDELINDYLEKRKNERNNNI